MSPGALYSLNSPSMQPMTLTGQMRLFEVDELPPQYKLGAARRRVLTYILAGMIAISVAAIATFLIIKLVREKPGATSGAIAVNSVPDNAEIYLDEETTPRGKSNAIIPNISFGTHKITLKLAGHAPRVETVVVREEADGAVNATLELIPGKIIIDSTPEGAEIRVDGQLKGVTPKSISGLDTRSAKKLELRLRGYQPYIQELQWPGDATITIKAQLKK
jgi:hypothetical protein